MNPLSKNRTAVKLDAYNAGKRAWQAQAAPGNNPHQPGTDEHRKWKDGYEVAKAASLPAEAPS